MKGIMGRIILKIIKVVKIAYNREHKSWCLFLLKVRNGGNILWDNSWIDWPS
jgi:hypothetical protein